MSMPKAINEISGQLTLLQTQVAALTKQVAALTKAVEAQKPVEPEAKQ